MIKKTLLLALIATFISISSLSAAPLTPSNDLQTTQADDTTKCDGGKEEETGKCDGGKEEETKKCDDGKDKEAKCGTGKCG